MLVRSEQEIIDSWSSTSENRAFIDLKKESYVVEEVAGKLKISFKNFGQSLTDSAARDLCRFLGIPYTFFQKSPIKNSAQMLSLWSNQATKSMVLVNSVDGEIAQIISEDSVALNIRDFLNYFRSNFIGSDVCIFNSEPWSSLEILVGDESRVDLNGDSATIAILVQYLPQVVGYTLDVDIAIFLEGQLLLVNSDSDAKSYITVEGPLTIGSDVIQKLKTVIKNISVIPYNPYCFKQEHDLLKYLTILSKTRGLSKEVLRSFMKDLPETPVYDYKLAFQMSSLARSLSRRSYIQHARIAGSLLSGVVPKC